MSDLLEELGFVEFIPAYVVFETDVLEGRLHLRGVWLTPGPALECAAGLCCGQVVIWDTTAQKAIKVERWQDGEPVDKALGREF